MLLSVIKNSLFEGVLEVFAYHYLSDSRQKHPLMEEDFYRSPRRFFMLGLSRCFRLKVSDASKLPHPDPKRKLWAL